MGGFAGMRVAAHHPELIRTLTLMNTTATKEKLLNRIKYAFLAQMVKIFSPAPFTPIAVKELFGQTRAEARNGGPCWNNGQGSCGRVPGISPDHCRR